MKRIFLVLLLALCAGTPCEAAGTIVQSGPVVPFHPGAFFGNGVLGDGGTPSSPYLNSLGLFNGANCPFGVSSQTTPGTATGQYSQFSICQTNTLTTFNFNGFGGLGAPSLQFNFDGTIYPFPFTSTGSSNVTVTSVTTIGTTVLSAQGQIVAVKTLVATPVSIVLPASSSFPSCPSVALSCPVITVKDQYGDAAAGLISVTTADGKNIESATTYYMPFTQQSTDFVLLGTSWMVK